MSVAPVVHVVSTQPAMMQHKPGVVLAQPMNNWTSGTCECCSDMATCLCVMCCGCYYYACLAQRMGENCCVGCSGYPAGCVPGGHMAMRAAFRTKHGIQGSICDDCCVMFWCLPCGMCQLAREMARKGYS